MKKKHKKETKFQAYPQPTTIIAIGLCRNVCSYLHKLFTSLLLCSYVFEINSNLIFAEGYIHFFLFLRLF